MFAMASVSALVAVKVTKICDREAEGSNDKTSANTP